MEVFGGLWQALRGYKRQEVDVHLQKKGADKQVLLGLRAC